MLLFRTTGTKGDVSTEIAKEKSPQATCRMTWAPLHLAKLKRASFKQVTLTILENNKEEEKGVKVQAKREKTQEDKPTFKKEEVNIIEK